MSGALPGTLYAFVLVSALSLLMLWRLRESLLALLRMVTTHSERYDQDYWGAFDAAWRPICPQVPGVIDLSCGPPLFLRDLARRYPSTSLYGYDITPR